MLLIALALSACAKPQKPYTYANTDERPDKNDPVNIVKVGDNPQYCEGSWPPSDDWICEDL
jgi:hypothetical protein